MPTPDDDIRYAGPTLGYTPGPGNSDQTPPGSGRLLDEIDGTYANPNYIMERLQQLQQFLQGLDGQLDKSLQNFALPITDDPADDALRQANESEWPSSLGTPRTSVTYQFYNMLGVKTTKAAAYIRARYEAACRDVTGINAIDLKPIVDAMNTEAQLQQQFMLTYIGRFDDTAEFRSAELTQDWVENAIAWSQRIQQIFQATDTDRSLPADEVDGLQPDDARQAQALFKVKLNALNDQIVQNLQVIEKTFSNQSDAFFNRYLGPAMTMRLNVNRKVVPQSTQIGKEVFRAAGALDTNLTVAQGDQLRRNRIFDNKMQETIEVINQRDTYRTYINQLAPIGAQVTPGTQGTTISDTATPDEINAFNQIVQSATGGSSSTNQFTAAHNSLTGRDATDAHDQYLLRSGGDVTGDISVDDGVLIDGVDISTHTHSGDDGSSKISGTSIEFGTLPVETIDVNRTPPAPTDLRLVKQSVRTSLSGISVVDIDLAWDGDLALQYEVNIAPLIS